MGVRLKLNMPERPLDKKRPWDALGLGKLTYLYKIIDSYY